MELVVLLFVATRFFREAASGSRNSVIWAIAGAFLYGVPLMLTKEALYQTTPSSPSDLFLFGALDVVLSNAVGLMVVTLAGRLAFQKASLRIESLSNVLNWAWLAGAILILANALAVGTADAPFYFGLLLMAAIPTANLLATRQHKRSSTARLPVVYALLALNLVAIMGAFYFVANLEPSRPPVMSLVAAYYSTWLALTAGCSILSISRRTWGSRLGRFRERLLLDLIKKLPPPPPPFQ